jgi:phosphatidylinositol glycan class B
MILFSVVFRVLVALFTQSYFQPDEYFQALEPAHKYVFGYGHLTWEWVNPEPLRSVLYPALNIPVYWLLKVSGLDVYPSLVVGFGPFSVDVSNVNRSLDQEYSTVCSPL